MNKEPERLTLERVRNSKLKKKVFQASDFLTKEEQLKLKRANFEGKKKQRRYNDIDAYIAEMIGRFGYEFYKDWKSGLIKTDQVNKYIAAERARDKSNVLALEAIVISMVGACIKREKKQPKPRGPKIAQNIFKHEEKIAKGEF